MSDNPDQNVEGDVVEGDKVVQTPEPDVPNSQPSEPNEAPTPDEGGIRQG
jgi:hypothetical protein